MWTFGFDTVYAMADSIDDKNLGLRSSVLSLGEKATVIVAISYAITSIFFAIGAHHAGVGLIFWPLWLIATLGMQREVLILNQSVCAISICGRHFKNQVKLGGLLLLALIIGRMS